MLKKRVAVLRGGPSIEYEVSMQTGAAVLAALESAGHQVVDITISKAGEWLNNGFVKAPEQVLVGVDAAFIAMHGASGEDGAIQRLLERLGIAYTGSGPYASAVALNKHLTKEHIKQLGFDTPPAMRLTRSGVSDTLQTVESIRQLFGPEYMVKPVTGGSSVDAVLATSVSELATAISALLEKHEEILVEERIVGKEATVGVLDGFRDQSPYVLPAVEITPPIESPYYSAEVKRAGTATEVCPGNFSKTEKEALGKAAAAIHNALNLRHYSRSDFIVTPEKIYFLEVNTRPPLADNSTFAAALISIGATPAEVVDHIINRI